jgi:hypothetical protein
MSLWDAFEALYAIYRASESAYEFAAGGFIGIVIARSCSCSVT